MIRRLLVVFAVLGATLVGAAPVSASAGTVSQTFHFPSNPLFSAPLPCSPLAGLNVISEDNGNGVIHQTTNSNGFWITGTYEGDVKIFPAESVTVDPITHIVTAFVPDLSRPTAQGRVADWFGMSVNRTVEVDHDAVNAQVTTSTGQAIRFHAVGHVQIALPLTDPPVITHEHMTATCS